MKNITYVTISRHILWAVLLLLIVWLSGCSTLPDHVSECTTAECTADVIAREDRKFRRKVEAEEHKRMAQFCWRNHQMYNKNNNRCVWIF